MNLRHQLRHLHLQSQVLNDSWLNTPLLRDVYVFLPPGFDETETYPVLYFLSGWGSDGEHFLHSSNVFAPSLPERLATETVAQRLPKFVGVFPSGVTPLGGSQWIDSPATGLMQTHLCTEVVPLVEKAVPQVVGQPRGVIGHSSGGFGALHLGAKHSELFPYVYAASADMWFEYLFVKLIPQAVSVLNKRGGVSKFVKLFQEHPNPMGGLKRSEGETFMLLNMAACFAPNQEAGPVYGDLFFDTQTGEVLDAVWSRWLAHDPLRCAGSWAPGLQKLKGLFLDCGRDDEYGLHLGQRQFSARLTALGIAHQAREYDGGHSGHSHRHVERVRTLLDLMARDSRG